MCDMRYALTQVTMAQRATVHGYVGLLTMVADARSWLVVARLHSRRRLEITLFNYV